MEYLKDIDLLKLSPFTLYKLFKQYEFDELFKNDKDIGFIDYKRIRYITQNFSGNYAIGKRKYWRLVGKRSRIKNDLEKLLEKECIFLTLTFDDKHIDMEDKRRKISRWLYKLNCNYLGNVDYGIGSSIGYNLHSLAHRQQGSGPSRYHQVLHSALSRRHSALRRSAQPLDCRTREWSRQGIGGVQDFAYQYGLYVGR